MTEPPQQVLHIGLAKTGTTTLQKHAFPQISQVTGYSYNPPELIERLRRYRLLQAPEDRHRIEQLRAEHAPVFVSDESLATWLPQHFETAADDMLSLWGRQTTILITLRDPDDFQASLYAGSYRSGAYLSPKQFFLPDEQYNRVAVRGSHWLDDFFNVDQLDFRRLIEVYQQRFDRVIAMPLETQFDLRTLARIFELGEDQRRVIAEKLASAPRLNSRPTAWEMKAYKLYVSLAGKQMTSPGLGTKLLSHAQSEQPGHHGDESAFAPRSAARRMSMGRMLWLRLRAVLNRILPDTPYQLPGDIYRSPELSERNREYLAELVARDRAVHDGQNS